MPTRLPGARVPDTRDTDTNTNPTTPTDNPQGSAAPRPRPGRSADGWKSYDALGRDHPLTTLRPPSPRAVAHAMRHDPTSAVWWLARADRIAAVSVLGAMSGRFISVEGVFYRLPGVTVWDALDALTARGPLSPRDAAIFPPEVLSAWGGGAGPEDLPALYLPSPPHTGFRVLAHGATTWERHPSGLPSGVLHRAPYVPEAPPLLCRLHTAGELRALVRRGDARYLPGTDPRWSLAVGGGPAGASVDPVARFYRHDPPDPADVAGSSLWWLDTPAARADARTRGTYVPAAWEAIIDRWTQAVAGAGMAPGASTGHRVRRAVVLRLGALPAVGRDGAPVFPGDTDDDGNPLPVVPAECNGWMVRVSREGPAAEASPASWGLHRLAAFLDAHGVALPPGCVPIGEGLAVWVGPRQTTAYLRSHLAHLALGRAREVLRDHLHATLGPGAIATLRARFTLGAPWDGPEGTAPVGFDVPPPEPSGDGHDTVSWGAGCPPEMVLRIEATRGYDAWRRSPAGGGAAGGAEGGTPADTTTADTTPSGWHRPIPEVSALGQLLAASRALGGEGPASAPAIFLAALVWPGRPVSRLLRAQYAGMGLTVQHWRAAVLAMLDWLDTGEPVRIPITATALWWALQVGFPAVAGLGPTRSRTPGVEGILSTRNREALARYDAALARPDAPEALAMIRADREMAYARRYGALPGEGGDRSTEHGAPEVWGWGDGEDEGPG